MQKLIAMSWYFIGETVYSNWLGDVARLVWLDTEHSRAFKVQISPVVICRLIWI